MYYRTNEEKMQWSISSVPALHGDVIIYQSEQENISTNVLFKDETFWMTQKDMAALFSVQVPAINKHLKYIFTEQELPAMEKSIALTSTT